MLNASPNSNGTTTDSSPGQERAPLGEPGLPGQHVLHVGPDPATQGGMASVIAEYLTFPMGSMRVASYGTWAPGSRVRSLWKAAELAGDIAAGKHARTTFHVHLSEFGSFVREGAVILAASWKARPVFISLHGADFMESLRKYPGLTKTVLGRATGIVCLGPKQRAVVEAFIPGVPTHLIPNPSGPGRLAPGALKRTLPDGRHFVFAGDVGTRKGFDLISRVWPDVAARYPDAHLHICGPTTDLPAPLSLPQSTYYGILSRAEVAALLPGAEALLLPSRREVLPMSILEALRLGTPVIASHAGEMDWFAESGGMSYCDTDAGSLGSAVFRLLAATAAEREAMSRAAMEWSAATTANERVARALRAMYEGATGHLDGGVRKAS